MLKYGLLGLLNYKDMSGYDLSKAFSESIAFFWTATMSQIYRELTSMEKCGWLCSQVIIQEGKPNKKNYSITPLGKESLMEWLTTYNGGTYFVGRNSFLVNLFFSGDKSISESISMLQRFRADCLEYAADLAQTEESINKYGEGIDNRIHTIYWEIVADLGRASMQETINWVERSINRLEKFL